MPRQLPRELLEWAARQPLVLAELERSDADVYCLEEVNRLGALGARGRAAAAGPIPLRPVTDVLEPFFRARGYEMRYKAKVCASAFCLDLCPARAGRGSRRVVEGGGGVLPQASSPAEAFGVPPDGTAIVFRTAKFEVRGGAFVCPLPLLARPGGTGRPAAAALR